MNSEIRDAQLQKIPYMLVVGDREAEQESVAVRLRSTEKSNLMAIGELTTTMKALLIEKCSRPEGNPAEIVTRAFIRTRILEHLKPSKPKLGPLDHLY